MTGLKETIVVDEGCFGGWFGGGYMFGREAGRREGWIARNVPKNGLKRVKQVVGGEMR